MVFIDFRHKNIEKVGRLRVFPQKKAKKYAKCFICRLLLHILTYLCAQIEETNDEFATSRYQKSSHHQRSMLFCNGGGATILPRPERHFGTTYVDLTAIPPVAAAHLHVHARQPGAYFLQHVRLMDVRTRAGTNPGAEAVPYLLYGVRTRRSPHSGVGPNRSDAAYGNAF